MSYSDVSQNRRILHSMPFYAAGLGARQYHPSFLQGLERILYDLLSHLEAVNGHETLWIVHPLDAAVYFLG